MSSSQGLVKLKVFKRFQVKMLDLLLLSDEINRTNFSYLIPPDAGNPDWFLLLLSSEAGDHNLSTPAFQGISPSACTDCQVSDNNNNQS